ncbi:unnamed protein product [Cylicocyclus nassatus]|uniref:Uncharacterized protein n=1 Tax=Cylicocyclus nassatus TaxID=53992 RepID=A0AA36ME31_CYLNA|nr:unnamed protein product [Cylicocyclus nassatus]
MQAALAPVILETARSRATSTSSQIENVLLKKDEISEQDDNADEVFHNFLLPYVTSSSWQAGAHFIVILVASLFCCIFVCNII